MIHWLGRLNHKHAYHSNGHMPSGNNRQSGNSWFQLLNLPVVILVNLRSSSFLHDIPTLGTVTSCPYHICTSSAINKLTRLHLDDASSLMPFTCAQLQKSLFPHAHVCSPIHLALSYCLLNLNKTEPTSTPRQGCYLLRHKTKQDLN